MKQVFLSGKGEIELFEVPVPGKLPSSILVRNAFSLISTGTEGAAVSQHGGWLGVAEKALQSRDRLQQVWTMARTQGVPQTFELVRRKLDDYTMLGYSCAGQVVEVSGNELPYQVGDRVACMGTGFATHSEYVSMPINLVAPLSPGVPYDEAAFAALACIAMQGIRRLELGPGENVALVGLGLIGQIAAQLLVALGYRVMGMDLSSERAATARALAGIEAWGTLDLDSVQRVHELTDGYGADGVLICAATSSDQPVNMAFDLCRQRGRVSVVGDVGLGLERNRMYRKELDLRMSTSYGPGRYDNQYELRGHDYPYGLVRWTEGRNLRLFLDLLQRGRLNLRPLISAAYPVEEAQAAYAQVKQGDTATYGVLLDYGDLPAEPMPISRELRTLRRAPTITVSPHRPLRIGLIGVGGYAKGVHIPNLQKLSDHFIIQGLASRSGANAAIVAQSTDAPLVTSDYRALLEAPEIDAVLIATRHASHAKMVLDALEAGKHVFVEKPMTTQIEDGQAILTKAAEKGLVLRVGFNRRFSPYLNAMREAVGRGGQRVLTCRVNIGALKEDWSNTPEEGGRLLGEGVHFLDLCNWFMGEAPLALSAMSVGEAQITNPNHTIQIAYPDGSSAQILYTTLGHKGIGKEYYEAFGNGRSVRSDDFQQIEAHGASVQVGRRERGDKGQLAALEEFALAVRGGASTTEGADAFAGLMATAMAHAVYESAQQGRWIDLRELTG